MTMYMSDKMKLFQEKPCPSFLQVAVSNWELYRLSQKPKAAYSNLLSHFPGTEDQEEYTDFLAGIAVGKKEFLGKNEKPDLLIVREKQLSETEYIELFAGLCEKVKAYEKKEKNKREKSKPALVIPHTYPAAAVKGGSCWLHLPLPIFRDYQRTGKCVGLHVGTSVHSVEQAKEAQRMGACYVTAGHIFSTDCKKGLPPRGIGFLEQVCASVQIPVFAIGGIYQENFCEIQQAGAAGACRMSDYIR